MEGTVGVLFETLRTQWLALLSLYSILVRSDAGRQRSELACVSFAVMAHARFMQALRPPPESTSDTKVRRFSARSCS